MLKGICMLVNKAKASLPIAFSFGPKRWQNLQKKTKFHTFEWFSIEFQRILCETHPNCFCLWKLFGIAFHGTISHGIASIKRFMWNQIFSNGIFSDRRIPQEIARIEWFRMKSLGCASNPMESRAIAWIFIREKPIVWNQTFLQWIASNRMFPHEIWQIGCFWMKLHGFVENRMESLKPTWNPTKSFEIA